MVWIVLVDLIAVALHTENNAWRAQQGRSLRCGYQRLHYNRRRPRPRSLLPRTPHTTRSPETRPITHCTRAQNILTKGSLGEEAVIGSHLKVGPGPRADPAGPAHHSLEG